MCKICIASSNPFHSRISIHSFVYRYTVSGQLCTAKNKIQTGNLTLHIYNELLTIIHNTLHTAPYTVNTTKCTQYNIPYTLHSAHYTVHTTQCTLYTIQYTLHSAHYTLYLTHYTVHTIHLTVHTTRCTLYTWPYTLHSAHHTKAIFRLHRSSASIEVFCTAWPGPHCTALQFQGLVAMMYID